jgi:hypothetical protein
MVCGMTPSHVDARYAGHHVLDELLVAGHVHNAYAQFAAQHAWRESQFDGQAAFLFRLQPVGVAARQHSDQPRLAVVDVPRGAQHHEHLGIDVGSQHSWRALRHCVLL